ncbi:hypothetical protein [Streptomyces wuyuanensis]|uniref:hypothetical protein n=1 Tax=Streptomyces wuyuanensis TaxID=1196353 RepID=UPI003721BB68
MPRGRGLAHLLGHGAAAVAQGDSPLPGLPGWLPIALLGIGLATGITQATVAALRAQRGAAEPDVLSGRLLGASWIAAFTALFLAIAIAIAGGGAYALAAVLEHSRLGRHAEGLRR